MARLIATATGNLTSSSTWATTDSTALVTEGGTATTTLTTSSQNSANFAPGAITVDALAIKVTSRAAGSPTNTMTVVLYDATSSSAVATVNVPVADIPAGNATTGQRPGWILISLGGSILLEAGKNYQVRLSLNNTSTAVAVMTNGTAANWQHILRTTTTAAPAAGDDMWILGLWTASGTWTQYTVTMDQTTTGTVYGSNPTAGTVEERSGIWVGRSTLTWPTGSSTALALAGRITAGAYGVVTCGTSASPIQRGFTARVVFSTATTHGFTAMNLSTASICGQSLTSGKNVNWTVLSADVTSGSTGSLTVDHDTGWTSGSTVYMSSTTLGTPTQAAPYTLSANAGTNSLTFTAALSAPYQGNDGQFPCPAHIILTNYNVQWDMDNVARRATHNAYNACALDLQWVRFQYGCLELAGCSTTVNISYVCLDGQAYTATTDAMFAVSGTCSGTWSVTNLTGVTAGNQYHWNITPSGGSTVSNFTFQNLIGIYDGASGSGGTITIGPYASFRTIRSLGGGAALSHTVLDGAGTVFTAPSDLHSGSMTFGSGLGITIPQGLYNATIRNASFVTTNANAWNYSNVSANITFSSCSFHSATTIFDSGTASKWTDVVFDKCIIGGLNAGGVSQTPTGLIALAAAHTSIAHMKFLGCTFSNSWCTAPSASIVDFGGAGSPQDPLDVRMSFVGCVTGSPTVAVRSQAAGWFTKESYVSFNKYANTSGDHRVYKPFSLNNAIFTEAPYLATDSTTFNTAAPSEKMVPKSASIKLESSVKRVAVASGQTATITVYVRKNAAYNGNAPRLICKQNDSAGYTADTVGDTHTAAADTWEQLSYTTSAVADDCVLEFVIDCDGTAGAVFVDDWAAS